VGRGAQEGNPRARAFAVSAIDWVAAEAALDRDGFARLPVMLSADECGSLAALYWDDTRFRSRIDMTRFRFGVGEYKYFAAPLPPIVQTLREELYPHLAAVANRWMVRLKPDATRSKPDATCPAYPATLDAFLKKCHAAGQKRPTPLLLTYSAGGYNCLHQDLYGDVAFPLQVVFVLSQRDVDYTGGELLLVEQRPRAQSRGHAVAIDRGAAVIFATNHRPAAGTRGDYRVAMRHGVSTVTSGRRMSLGVIFHDAK
jgi:uncharacterized protein